MPIRIRSLSASSGFLKNASVVFADGLTCIIGARGTCKSTIVESIRFAFNCEPDRVAVLLAAGNGAETENSSRGLIRTTLDDGVAKVDLIQRDASGDTQLVIERDVDAPSRVYRDGIKELSDLSVLHAIEIYSQGDLQRIAESDELRLELIDRPHKNTIASLRKERESAAERLQVLGQQIRVKRGEIEARRGELQGLDARRVELTELRAQRPSLSKELDAEHEAYLRRKAFLEQLQAAAQQRQQVLSGILTALEHTPEVQSLALQMRELEISEAQDTVEELKTFASFTMQTRNVASAAEQIDLVAQMGVISQALEARNARYYQLRQEQQAVNETLKKEETLKKQVLHLERLAVEFNQLLDEQRKLAEKRTALRARINQLSDRMYQLRLQQVEQINSAHSDVVLLTLEQGAQSNLYAHTLSILLSGSRLRNQEDVARDLADKIRPADIIDIVEGGDSQRLATILGRDLGQMARLVSHLMDHGELYELEGIVFDDRLEITFYDGDVPKPVSHLSRGQMATALLPLILRTADYPLIFDQPEDDLDNSFIYTTLVERIRSLKEVRQLIFVTHNANIPVLGDADKIIVMQMESPTCAAARTVGSVEDVKEHILTLLEGGADAFKRRYAKYENLLGSDN